MCIIFVKKTRTGFKFKIVYVHNDGRLLDTAITCTHRSNVLDAEIAAYNHIRTHHLGFNHFPEHSELS